jgi:hypothetical protein
MDRCTLCRRSTGQSRLAVFGRSVLLAISRSRPTSLSVHSKTAVPEHPRRSLLAAQKLRHKSAETIWIRHSHRSLQTTTTASSPRSSTSCEKQTASTQKGGLTELDRNVTKTSSTHARTVGLEPCALGQRAQHALPAARQLSNAMRAPSHSHRATASVCSR